MGISESDLNDELARVDADNSTTVALGSNAAFTGAWVDILLYNNLFITVYSDQASAASGLAVQWSNNGSTVHRTSSKTVSAGVGKSYSFGRLSRYYRVVYTNGSIAQGSFSLQTINTRGIAQVDTNVELISPLPSLSVVERRVVASNSAYTTTSNVTANTAFKEFIFGGRGPGEGMFGRYVAATTQLGPFGGFNSSGDVSNWPSTSLFALLNSTPLYSTTQAFEGTGSVRVDFDKSDQNNYPEITYTYSSPVSLDVWRYVRVQFYNSVPAGGAVTRTISIVLTDNVGNKRFYSVSGSTGVAPFNAAGWIQILGEIRIPSSQTGATFDVNNISAISLRLVDSGNKAGVVYWDALYFVGAIDIIQKIYTNGNTIPINFDPIKLFSAGEVVYLAIRNNDTVSREYQISVSGVDIT